MIGYNFDYVKSSEYKNSLKNIEKMSKKQLDILLKYCEFEISHRKEKVKI